ncbi:hypothetical protein VW35_11075 [Devosia soli]|uniref:Uncharacterized protein n=1 Tax=Devosia soli TaxID=361041 RepID=A0A0F5L9B7_9HYPH|nr:TetR/AcrR family transcriptional regulator [Devosia soli]KKB78202.1 hypothetical protein VW35_11075 [Devosia soli]
MPRTKGSRDRAFAEKRNALIGLARALLSSPAGRNASWREIAAACSVSVSTMNHYFADRGSLVAAIVELAESEGAPYLAMTREPSGPFAQSIADLVFMIAQGFTHGVLALQVIGLGEGFSAPGAAKAYLGHHLEPVLGAIATRLERHVALGEMVDTDVRFAAIALLSPLLVAHLHQSSLGGSQSHPMSLADFGTHHAAAFVRAYRTENA